MGYLFAGALNGVPKLDATFSARTDVAVRRILLLLSAAARKTEHWLWHEHIQELRGGK